MQILEDEHDRLLLGDTADKPYHAVEKTKARASRQLARGVEQQLLRVSTPVPSEKRSRRPGWPARACLEGASQQLRPRPERGTPSPSAHRPQSARAPRDTALRATSPTTAVLPIPGSPVTNTSWARPDTAESSTPPSTASTGSRPTSPVAATTKSLSDVLALRGSYRRRSRRMLSGASTWTRRTSEKPASAAARRRTPSPGMLPRAVRDCDRAFGVHTSAEHA